MMDMELVRMYLKRYLGLTLVVGLLVGLTAGGLGIMFPEMSVNDASSVASSWPPMMKALFGDPLAGFTDIYAWLDLEIFHVTFWMVLGTLAAILASRIVAQEAELRTLDVLLCIPRSRSAILTSRLLGLSVLMVMAGLSVAAGCCAGIAVRGLPVDVNVIALSTAAGVLLTLVLANITLLVSIWIPRQIPAVAISMGAAGMLFFTEEMLIPIMPWLDRASFLNPFHWYDTGDILIRGMVSPWPLLVLLVMALGCGGLSLVTFTLRDAPA
jgi:ABC-2 type transport system permease protein